MIKSIYRLKQASRSWNLRFDETIKTHGIEQNVDEPCVYKLTNEQIVVFLVPYVDDILLIGYNVVKLSEVKTWLAEQFQIKDLGNASYVIGIQNIRDKKNKLLALSQASYVDKVLTRFSMQKSKSCRPDMQFPSQRSSVLRHRKKKRTWDGFHIHLQLEV